MNELSLKKVLKCLYLLLCSSYFLVFPLLSYAAEVQVVETFLDNGTAIIFIVFLSFILSIFSNRLIKMLSDSALSMSIINKIHAHKLLCCRHSVVFDANAGMNIHEWRGEYGPDKNRYAFEMDVYRIHLAVLSLSFLVFINLCILFIGLYLNIKTLIFIGIIIIVAFPLIYYIAFVFAYLKLKQKIFAGIMFGVDVVNYSGRLLNDEQRLMLSNNNKQQCPVFLKEQQQQYNLLHLKNGIYYQVLVSGEGDMHPQLKDDITVRYTAKNMSGEVFDGSYFRRGDFQTFQIRRLINGWQQVLPYMTTGDKWRVFLPPEQAFDEKGAGQYVQPSSVVSYDIELLDIHTNHETVTFNEVDFNNKNSVNLMVDNNEIALTVPKGFSQHHPLSYQKTIVKQSNAIVGDPIEVDTGQQIETCSIELGFGLKILSCGWSIPNDIKTQLLGHYLLCVYVRRAEHESLDLYNRQHLIYEIYTGLSSRLELECDPVLPSFDSFKLENLGESQCVVFSAGTRLCFNRYLILPLSSQYYLEFVLEHHNNESDMTDQTTYAEIAKALSDSIIASISMTPAIAFKQTQKLSTVVVSEEKTRNNFDTGKTYKEKPSRILEEPDYFEPFSTVVINSTHCGSIEIALPFISKIRQFTIQPFNGYQSKQSCVTVAGAVLGFNNKSVGNMTIDISVHHCKQPIPLKWKAAMTVACHEQVISNYRDFSKEKLKKNSEGDFVVTPSLAEEYTLNDDGNRSIIKYDTHNLKGSTQCRYYSLPLSDDQYIQFRFLAKMNDPLDYPNIEDFIFYKNCYIIRTMESLKIHDPQPPILEKLKKTDGGDIDVALESVINDDAVSSDFCYKGPSRIDFRGTQFEGKV